MEQQFNLDPNIAYDVIELPSRGIYYPNNKKSVKISYLTAADENILTSPSLIATSKVIDEILKRKVLDRDINTDDLVEEDRQAILIFLRNTAFGSDYTIKTTDPKTGEIFEFKTDLSTLKTKEFTLVEDNNGEFSYFMEKSNVTITFKFLSKKQLNELDIITETWNGVGFAPIITRRLEMMIRSVDGNKDPLFVRNFVQNLPIKDSQDFRKFISINKPGLDLIQTVTTPSKETIQVEIGFGVEFFRPFYGL